MEKAALSIQVSRVNLLVRGIEADGRDFFGVGHVCS
jgi:hypothetical protein